MNKKIFLLVYFTCISIYCQDEKRLALIIGNGDYEKGILKNPVSDAKLMAKTLDSLGFEVLLHTNIEKRRDFLSAINEFGNKLPEYDVSFVYYAGHGIQINSENFLLPTKELFEAEIDVEDYGVSVQRILKYIETENEKKINIVVIDACRDNPFEQNWNRTRSLKGTGLAKINPPTGSIIAFSTDSGNTAPDGDGDNSIYTKFLSENLYKGGVSIEQVFKNVRSDVLDATNKVQKPIENNTLIGDPYIINKTELFFLNEKYTKFFYEHLTLNGYYIEEKHLLKLKELTNKIKKLDPNDNAVFITELLILLNAKNTDYDLFDDYYSKLNLSDVSKNSSNWYKYLNFRRLLFQAEESAEFVFADSGVVSDVGKSSFLNKELWFNLANNLYSNYLELRSINHKDFYHFSYYDLTVKARYIDRYGNRIADLLTINGYQIKGLEIAEELLTFFDNSLKENKSYYDKNPEDLRMFNEHLVFIETTALNIKSILNYPQNKISSGWRKLYKNHPNNTNLLITRVYKILSLYEFELAVTMINKIIPLSPDDPEPYFLLYYIYNDQENYSNALLNLDYSIERMKDGFFISDQIKNIGKELLVSDGYNSIDPEKIELWQLRIIKAELLQKLGNDTYMCEEYKTALKLAEDEETIAEIRKKIPESCGT